MKRLQSILLPSLFFLAAAGVCVLTLRVIHFPDIGTVTRSMDDGLLKTAGDQMTQMEIQLIEVNRILTDLQLKIKEMPSVNRDWIALDRCWSVFRDRPDDLRSLKALSEAFSGMASSLKILRKAAASRKNSVRDHKGERLLYHIDLLSDLIQDMQKYMRNNTEKKVVFSGRLIAWALSLLAAAVAPGIFLYRTRRKDRIPAEKSEEKT